MELTKTKVESLFKLFENKDVDQIMVEFAEDAVFIDPHYPVMEMKGKEAIRKGLVWGLKPLVKARFLTQGFWISGNEGAIKLKTNHVLKGGKKIDIIQVFLFSFDENQKITYLQSFVPYRPPGISGIILGLTRLFWK